MESTAEDGLFVDYDEETGLIQIEWDPIANPEYNFLEGLTSEEFSQILFNSLKNYEAQEVKTCEVQAGGSSCGKTESHCDSEPKC